MGIILVSKDGKDEHSLPRCKHVFIGLAKRCNAIGIMSPINDDVVPTGVDDFKTARPFHAMEPFF